MNKLVKGNLVRGLPSKLFENDQTCVACQKRKQHRASCKSKTENSISLPLHLLHMDLFGLTFVKSLMKKMYCLVVTDDYSRFTWVFFLASNDETSGILKSFITRIENLVDHKVKVIRCDNGTEFKNREMNKFCEMKGILRQFSVARTPQQNGVAKRRNRTLIEDARTMLAILSCQLLFGQKQLILLAICPVTILNIIDHLGKFDGKADEGFFVGYSLNSKAFRVFNSRTRIVEENLHIRFSENTPNVVGSGPDWLFDIDSLTRTMNYELIVAGRTQKVNSCIERSKLDIGLYRSAFFKFQVTEVIELYAFLYGKIGEEVYVCQPPGFEDPDFLDKVYKVEKALCICWSCCMWDDIIFGSTKKELCIAFEKLMHEKFQMSSMGELTFFLGLQVHQKKNGIFISQDKYVAEILKKFRSMISSLMYLTSSIPDIIFVVCACARYQVNPKVSHLHAVKRIFSDYARASLDRKSTIGGCQFLGCRLISWQCKKQTVVANSTTEAEYVAASSCCGQVLWIHNQLLDYGFMYPPIDSRISALSFNLHGLSVSEHAIM
ncbi:putative ribonuclease H-like domain-containing protein [Tanacetum coccineum]